MLREEGEISTDGSRATPIDTDFGLNDVLDFNFLDELETEPEDGTPVSGQSDRLKTVAPLKRLPIDSGLDTMSNSTPNPVPIELDHLQKSGLGAVANIIPPVKLATPISSLQSPRLSTESTRLANAGFTKPQWAPTPPKLYLTPESLSINDGAEALQETEPQPSSGKARPRKRKVSGRKNLRVETAKLRARKEATTASMTYPRSPGEHSGTPAAGRDWSMNRQQGPQPITGQLSRNKRLLLMFVLCLATAGLALTTDFGKRNHPYTSTIESLFTVCFK